MSAVVSKSQYAALRNVSLPTVSNWIARGLLTHPALRPDGTIDVDAADLHLRARIDPTRSLAQAPRGFFGVRDEGADEETLAGDDPVRRRQVALADQAETTAREQ